MLLAVPVFCAQNYARFWKLCSCLEICYFLKVWKNTKLAQKPDLFAFFLSTGVFFGSAMGWPDYFLWWNNLQSSAKYSDTYRCWPGNWLMRSCNEAFFTSDAPELAFAVGFLQAPRSLAISACFGLSGNCCPATCRLLDAMLPVKAGIGTDGIFSSGVHSPLVDQRRSIAVIFFALPQMNENRLNHGQSLKTINLRD